MPVDAALVGRTWPAREYEVGRETVREFATAVGAIDEVHHDVAAARASGHRDLVAPTTFGVVPTWRATLTVVEDPALGLDFSRVVHRDQSFTLHRPLYAGDVLSTTVAVDDVRVLAGNDVVTFRCTVRDADGAEVLTTTATLVARAAEENPEETAGEGR